METATGIAGATAGAETGSRRPAGLLPPTRPPHDRHCPHRRHPHRRLCAAREGDPAKLVQLKAAFLGNRTKYLLCVREPDVPMTNNKAERALRPLVIKRKLSFGSKTHRGAQAM